ncbi:hypothetical protein NP233_g7866 [Leucocoprinus birnbaumii]|uniref:PNK3P-domain-containing protein n=1 Tax=Leucocoprinus birnbaumii TaxID=56174 RepID=A0AAD5VTW6_9AGAR|nr:hypothetical protein NP233_g7866 [Leucocoprinus birnbaumii]
MIAQLKAGLSKRPAEESPAEEPAPKKSKYSVSSRSIAYEPAVSVHPFFIKGAAKPSEPPGPFQWLEPLGKNKTCLHGKHLEPKCYSKVAAFDLDGTIIKFTKQTSTSSGWDWWNATVPAKLRSVAEEGYTIVIISNQAIKPGPLKQWKEKVAAMALELKDVPFWIFAANARDEYRKPMLGMWWEVEKIFKTQSVQIDLKASFFVGDAAGRQYKNQKSDFSSTDRKLALNIGIRFMTPEEYFLNLPAHTNYILPGFHVSSLPDLTPTSSPIIPHPRNKEIVLFCGLPALGKSSFYSKHFLPANYTHINQDTLKTRDKCVKAAREALRRNESCVIDNTNRDAKTRKFYVDLAKEEKVPIRCFVFTGSIDLAWHNNLYRAFHRPSRETEGEIRRVLVPYGAFSGFQDQYEEPTKEEGFAEIRRVNWKFEGTEEEKRLWSMWLQIDGK